MKLPLFTAYAVALLTAWLALTQATPLLAQPTTRYGIKGGLNASTLFIDNVTNRKERIGFHAGVFAQAPITSFLAIQPELLYTTKGASADYSFQINGRNTIKLNYIELPVLLTFKLGKTAELQAGPYAAYLLNRSVTTDFNGFTSTIVFGSNEFNKIDYGLAGGLNLFFGKALIGLRYGQGLNKIANSTTSQLLLGNTKNAVGMVSVGYSFN